MGKLSDCKSELPFRYLPTRADTIKHCPMISFPMTGHNKSIRATTVPHHKPQTAGHSAAGCCLEPVNTMQYLRRHLLQLWMDIPLQLLLSANVDIQVLERR